MLCSTGLGLRLGFESSSVNNFIQNKPHSAVFVTTISHLTMELEINVDASAYLRIGSYAPVDNAADTQ